MRFVLTALLVFLCGSAPAAEPKLSKDKFALVQAEKPFDSSKLESLLKEKGERPDGEGWKYDRDKKCWWRYATAVPSTPNCPTGNCPLPGR